jgi:amino acid permease
MENLQSIMPCLGLVLAVVFVVVPFWMIFTKAGFNGALSLLMLIPLVNIIMISYLAFAEWTALEGK